MHMKYNWVFIKEFCKNSIPEVYADIHRVKIMENEK